MATSNQLEVMARHYVIVAIWADCPEGTNPRVTKAAERIALERYKTMGEPNADFYRGWLYFQ